MGTKVIGPYFFDARLDGRVYLEFLDTEVPLLLEDIPLDVRRQMWFQHDGAPPHSSGPVVNWLNENYLDRWIGRGGPVPWPARSPDLTPLDYFLWGFVKDKVYQVPSTTRDDMKNRIRECFHEITVETLQGVENRFRENLNLCIANFGGHFEQLF